MCLPLLARFQFGSFHDCPASIQIWLDQQASGDRSVSSQNLPPHAPQKIVKGLTAPQMRPQRLPPPISHLLPPASSQTVTTYEPHRLANAIDPISTSMILAEGFNGNRNIPEHPPLDESPSTPICTCCVPSCWNWIAGAPWFFR